MAAVLVAGTCEVELVFGLDGETIENTLYFNKTGAWTPAEFTALGSALHDWWQLGMSTHLSSTCALIAIKLTDLTSLTGAAITYSTGLPSAGTVSAEPVPNNVAPCITLHTANRGRSYRGRNYIGGIPNDQVSTNRFLATIADPITAAYMQLIDVASAQACTWVVVSRYSGITVVGGRRVPTPRSEGISTPVLSASFTDNVVDSQRRRLPNH